MPRRMYVAGEGESLRFCIVESPQDAALQLGATYRLPDPDDIRQVWNMAKLGELSGAEIREKYGVSRQTIDNWWRKAGGAGLTRRLDKKTQERKERVRETLIKMPGKRATVIARSAGVSVSTVREVAQEMGVEIPKWQRRPNDQELVQIAKGKTWMEFADAVGLKLSTLRAYIYAKPKLSKAISKVRAQAPSAPAGGKIDPQKVWQMYQEGMSAYKIAQVFKVEQMSVRHWIKRMAQEHANDKASDERTTPDAVAGSGGGVEL